MGKFKVPALRNVDKRTAPDLVKAYGHNGYFRSLEEIVFFYHWRGMMDSENRATLGMFPGPQAGNIVAFLKTLSDGYLQC